MKKENQRIMLTKRLLKDSLIALLKEKDIYQISISELCTSAGINRTTFYRYYGSQFDLLREMESDALDRIADMLIHRGPSATQMLASILSYLEENIDLFRLLINNNVDPEFPRRLFRLEPIRDTLSSALYPKYSENDLEYVSAFTTYGSFHLLRKWLNKVDREPPEKVAHLVSDLARFITHEPPPTAD